MRTAKALRIQGAIIDKKELEKYLENIASDHILEKFSSKNTYPIYSVINNLKYITKTYDILNDNLKNGITIHPAGEWLLDNLYIIEEAAKSVIKDLSMKKYTRTLGLASGMYKGFARVYVLASEIVAYTDSKFDSKVLKDLLSAYQRKKTLNMEEIWDINLYLKIALIENITVICERIYSAEIQKCKVENIIERLIEKKSKKELKFNNKYTMKNIDSEEFKYPFIEYMSYKLKKYGKMATGFNYVLEEQVEKMGTNVAEVIKKEHYDMALRKVSIGNAIKSLKELQSINFLEIFEDINGVEEILRKDPEGIYSKMSFKTKSMYRNAIKELSVKTKISEIYIAKKALALAMNDKESYGDSDNKSKGLTKGRKTSHIGYYLIDKGINELIDKLEIGRNRISSKQGFVKDYDAEVRAYCLVILVVSSFISIWASLYFFRKTSNVFLTLLEFFILFIPITEIVVQVIQYVLNKLVKTKEIPKLDLINGVPEELSSVVVIPTILNNRKKVKELMRKLEVFYLANKSDNLYFCLLGDVTASAKINEDVDDEIIDEGLKEVERLNKKYSENNMFPKFHFLYRSRVWSSGESCYLGWERKRGLLTQFNEFLLNNEENKFRVNTFEDSKKAKCDEGDKCNVNFPRFKYVITLDADTNLTLNSGLELIGAMAHILNKPILNNDGIVSEGYGIMQPRVGVGLLESRRSLFTQIYANDGGVDLYANAISDIYQDNFGEGIYTGKGIYDLRVFSQVLKNEIPDNTVLSHDLLEGNYLRCGLASDIVLLDGYPYKYNAYSSRQHRWIRGDWQIVRWLKKYIRDKNGNRKKNPLSFLSKFKIIDNLRRSLLDFFSVVNIIFLIVVGVFYKKSFTWIILLTIFANIVPLILNIVNNVVFKRENIKKQKTFVKRITGLEATFWRMLINFSVLPYQAYEAINAIAKTIYRVKFSKKHLLEWCTAEEAEVRGRTDLTSYYKTMIINVFCGIIAFFWNPILSFLWIIAPLIVWYVSKENKEDSKLKELSEADKTYISEIARETWGYFEEYINKENNFLPPDNFQEDRCFEIVDRTSSTNIGLALLTIVSAYDLGYIDLKNAIGLIGKMLNVIEQLDKWNGHLYNWYNIKTLKPLVPRYVSTVDSGNFIGYLYTIKGFLEEIIQNNEVDKSELDYDLNDLIKIIDNIIINTDFSLLYSNEKGIFSIGFNVEENKLTDSYYDLLASEARQASLIAIAKKDVTSKHWNNLSRTLTVLGKYKGLISWSGTAFEYFMPNINIPKYPGSLLDESSKFMLMSQKKYAEKLGTAWGISESAFNLRDFNSNYQYKAFGIPWLGLKRGLADEMVVSSYGSILTITENPVDVVKNLKVLEKQGMHGRFGFFEALDYTPERLSYGKSSEPVKTYMAHHQALILLSINNLFNDNILQKRFMRNPEIEGLDILLQEKMPETALVTKEKKEKVEKIKYSGYESYSEKIYTRVDDRLNRFNVISNGEYSIILNERGEGYSKYKNVLINRYKNTTDYSQGINVYIKNVTKNSNKEKRNVWSSINLKNSKAPDEFAVHFTPSEDKYVRKDGAIETTTKIVIDPNNPIEIRSVEIKNNGNQEECFEVTGYIEPVLSSMQDDYSHMAFNNLFLKYEKDDENIIVKRNVRNPSLSPIFLATDLVSNAETVGDLEYEINKDKLYQGRIDIPEKILNSVPFSNSLGLVVEPCIALRRTIKVQPNERVILNLVISVGENRDDVVNNLNKYKNFENADRLYELSKVKAEEEARYLGVKGKDILVYQKIMSYLLFQNPMKAIILNEIKYNKMQKFNYRQKDLWKYGISGDLPILLLKVKSANDKDIIREVLKAFEYLKTKNVFFDLVILNEEENSYERYVKDIIQTEILNNQLGYLQNINGGIFVLDLIDLEDKDLFDFVSNLVVDAKLGNLSTNINDLEEEILENNKNQIIDVNATQDVICNDSSDRAKFNDNEFFCTECNFFNGYGGFSKDGKEYRFVVNRENRVPTIWSHVIANKNFGTLVTHNLGGYTWSKNSRLNRITAWGNNSVIDIPSEIIYIKDEDTKDVWALSPALNDSEVQVTYGFGYANFSMKNKDINHTVQVFVPNNDNVKINILHLENKKPEKRKLRLVYYLKTVLGEDELKSNGYIDITQMKSANVVYASNVFSNGISKNVYVSSSERILSFTGDKKFFFGNSDVYNPQALIVDRLNNKNSLGLDSCMAIEMEIELEAFSSKDISLILGEEAEIYEIRDKVNIYSSIENCFKELGETKKYWNDLLGGLTVTTPVDSMNILLNGWLSYQAIVCRLYARSAFYQSGGAFGFRDQLQDTLGLKFLSEDIMKQQILKHCSHQFIDGDVEHWWHDDTNSGIRTRFSDDLLWLPYVVSEYINFTGDTSILDEEIAYREGQQLANGEDERYEEHLLGDKKENVYQHCIRAIERSLKFGEHDIPKIGSGDWNDGFSTVGNKGKGESVWLGFFLYDILIKFIDISRKKGEVEIANKYEEVCRGLKKVLNDVCWDGRWYKRAFTDNGETLGSAENEECKIDNISQTWSIISNAGDNDKKYICLENLENHLVDSENGIIKLLDPPFERSSLEPGYIKAYLPGVRENGGQYTHAAVWTIIAEAILGFGDKAVEYFRLINPIEHSKTMESAKKYKVEPYVVAADIYGKDNLIGRGGWTWYTGAASWLYKAGVEYILGLKIENRELYIKPAIPSDWEGFSIQYKYKSSIYNIKYKNGTNEVKRIFVNGNEITEDRIRLSDDGKVYNVEIK